MRGCLVNRKPLGRKASIVGGHHVVGLVELDANHFAHALLLMVMPQSTSAMPIVRLLWVMMMNCE